MVRVSGGRVVIALGIRKTEEKENQGQYYDIVKAVA